VADMSIHDRIDSTLVDRHRHIVGHAPVVFADANVAASGLAHLAKIDRRGILVADAVSHTKAVRLRPVLPSLDLVFANRREAAAICDRSATLTAVDLAATLCNDGAGMAVVSDGARHVAIAIKGKPAQALPVPTAVAVDETGAGDALVAGTLSGLVSGRELADAVRLGIKVARLCLESVGSGFPISRLDELDTTFEDAGPRAKENPP
ncbi:MAG: PfkB family carbohydrate kinase, partial [Pseudomonadota bacterium]